MPDHELKPGHDGWFMRSAAAVGDLSNPFYAEERQRDVWNEASAVGFQLMLWLGMIAATVMIWLGRSTALPYAIGIFAVVGVASLVTLGYARQLGVDAETTVRVWRWHTAAYTALMLVFFLGVARASIDTSLPPSVLIGFATGGIAVIVWSAARLIRQRRRLNDESEQI